ncbi:hypothetical protein HGRIS_000626 [Hohenbuehelia grisea]|uniref:DUF7330 domain-containing protein n=1 Tax=Hohenbuehelia grisea TaxID=104357 RepID=A0ABR3JRS2_9AGAR
MIIAPEDVDPSLASDQKIRPETTVVVNRAIVPPPPPVSRNETDSHDPPPAYESPASTPSSARDPPLPSASSSSSGTAPNPEYPPLPAQYQPTNFLSICRQNGAIKETYVIDPLLQIPPALLPSLGLGETEADRKNLSLESYNGSINVNVHLVNSAATSGEEKPTPRARIRLVSKNGSVTGKITSPHPAPIRPSCSLVLHSYNGSISVVISRDFHGPLKLHSNNGTVRLSDAVRARATDFGDLNGHRVWFIGDFSGYKGTENSQWAGDDLIGDTKNGSVRVSFADEIVVSCTPGKSLISRILGF